MTGVLTDKESRLLVDRFTGAWNGLNGKSYVVQSPAAARTAIRAIASARSVTAAVAWADPLLAELDLAPLFASYHSPANLTDGAAFRAACAQAGVGITTAELAMADTGTLLLPYGPQWPRSVSVLPPTWITVFPAERLVAGRSDLFRHLAERARGGRLPAEMGLLTGPSSTGDIENISQQGAHGPGDVYAVILLRRPAIPQS